MQEPFSSLHAADAPQSVDGGRPIASGEGLPCNTTDQQSIVSAMTASVAGDASVASEILPSSVAGEERQQHIGVIEPINPFLENTSISSASSPGGIGSCEDAVAPAPSVSTSVATADAQMNIEPVLAPPLSGAPRIGQQSTTTSSEADDDHTAPSSTGRAPMMPTNDALARFFENAKRKLLPRKDSDEDDSRQGLLISGYLQKLGRNGKWQTRWFETDGECLSYYKNQKRSKLLATLELQKVGLIEIEPEDATECSFRIQVLGRDYHLRASTRGSCKDWVINLNRVKEAKLGQGGVRLVGQNRPVVDLLDPGTPKLVVVANRQRTRAVDEEEQWDRLIRSDDPAAHQYARASALSSASLSNSVVGRWSKRNSTLKGVGSKLSRWARSLKKYSCAEIEREKILLDRHVHPPGHDDKKRKAKRPEPLHDRSISTTSDYDARILS